jgi:hypothetical protein
MNLINDVIGKRIKGEAEKNFEVEESNDLSDLLHLLRDDARKALK